MTRCGSNRNIGYNRNFGLLMALCMRVSKIFTGTGGVKKNLHRGVNSETGLVIIN
jgi:hypothetical protein